LVLCATFLHWGSDMTTKQRLTQRVRQSAKHALWGFGIAVTVITAACTPSPDPAHQTVEYYRANPEARESRVAECANDPGTMGKTPDCINAKQAAQIEGIGNLRDLPPMGLSKDAEERSRRTEPSNDSTESGTKDSLPHKAN